MAVGWGIGNFRTAARQVAVRRGWRTAGIASAACVTLLAAGASPTTRATAADGARPADPALRIPLPTGRPQARAPEVGRSTDAAASPIARAAYGERMLPPVPAPFVGALATGHSIACDGCGACAACDACPSCGVEPSCGLDIRYGIEPACGAEGFYCGAPGCVTCGGSPSCGAEGFYCGAAGCDACGGSPSCGAEGFYCGAPGCDACGGSPSCGAEGFSCGAAGCDACGGFGRGGAVECFPLMLPVLRIDWCRFEFFAGVQGFTGPPNFASASGAAAERAGTGSFGFHEGLNEGRTLKPWLGIDWAAQFGMRATQNNLSGAPFTTDQRNQLFLTGGFFRRADYGLQTGLVLDYLNDDWYYHSELTQIRGELSWRTGTCHTIGYRFMAGIDDAVSGTSIRDAAGALSQGSLGLTATDQHRVFYRRDLGAEGAVDLFAGLTGGDDGLLGLQIDTPLRGSVGLRSAVSYLIPEQGSGSLGHQEESWNVSMAIVWRPCGPTDRCSKYYKPLFDVADNGSFLVDRL